MKEMYFPFRNGATDACTLNWCWMEWLVHQRIFTLGGLIEAYMDYTVVK
jgi:hypothetical protein